MKIMVEKAGLPLAGTMSQQTEGRSGAREG
jgi:hypothetical protein